MTWLFVGLIAARSSLDILAGVHLGHRFFNVPSFVGLLVFLLLAVLILRHKSAIVVPGSGGWLVWLACLAFSVGIGFVDPGGAGLSGLKEWIRLASIAAVFILSYSLGRDVRTSRRALGLLFFALPIPLLTAFAQWIFHSGRISGGRHRVLGTMAHPNSMGIFLVLFAGLTFWKFRTTKKIPWLVLLFFELFVLAKTLSLSSYLMTAVLFGILFIGEERKGKILAAAAVVFLAAIVLTGMESKSKIETAGRSMRPEIRKEAPTKKQRPDSFTWRVLDWAELIRVWERRPVLGYGLHASLVVNPFKTPSGTGYPPHNDYIRYLVETGAVGLLVYLAFAVFYLGRFTRSYRSAREPAAKSLLLTVGAVFAAWLFGALGANVMNMTSSQFVFWAAAGFALAAGERERAFPGGSRRRSLVFVYPFDAAETKIGGIETFIRGLATSLPPDWDVRIAGISRREDGRPRGVWKEMDFHGRRIFFASVIRVEDPNRRTRIPLFLRYSFALAALRSRLDLDGRVLSFHRIEPALALAGISAERVYFMHGNARDLFTATSESRWRKLRPVYDACERFLIGSMRRIFVVNRTGRDLYGRIYPRIADRFSFMPAAYDPRVFRVRKGLDRKAVLGKFGIPDTAPILLFAGRLEGQKTPFLLIESFGLIRRELPGAVLLVAGQGLLEPGLKKRAEELSLGTSVIWLGARSREEIAELMNTATILLLTSAYEGMPRVVVEALACGLPVVSTDAGDAGLVVREGFTGRIVASHDPRDIARAAVEVLKDPPRFDPEKPPVSGYTLDKVLRPVLEELERAAEEHGR